MVLPGEDDSDAVKLIVGLGNPGRQYEQTRHNVGFVLVDTLVAQLKGGFRSKDRFGAEMAEVEVEGRTITVMKPLSFMNLSGEPVGAVSRFLKIAVPQVVVVHDDIDIPLGRVRLKRGGGDGGHNGIRSLVQHLGSREFVRIRLGVGRPLLEVGALEAGASEGGDAGPLKGGEERPEIRDWVLGRFAADERAQVAAMVERAIEAIRSLLSDGLTIAQNRWNR